MLVGMSAPSFVHLHAHSAYSLSEGAIKAEKLVSLAKADGMPAVALTDTANLFGALEFAQACAGKGIQPIMGCQLFLGRAATEDTARFVDAAYRLEVLDGVPHWIPELAADPVAELVTAHVRTATS